MQKKNTGNSHLEHASPLMGIVGQGFASPTQPAESKEDKNFDCTNTLPNVATDASIKGASNELNSEGDDADKWPAWRVGVQLHDMNGRYECRICMRERYYRMKLFSTKESYVSHFMEEHANLAEWMDDGDLKC